MTKKKMKRFKTDPNAQIVNDNEPYKRYQLNQNSDMRNIQLTFAYYDYVRDYFDFRNCILDLQFTLESIKKTTQEIDSNVASKAMYFYAQRIWLYLDRLHQYQDVASYAEIFVSGEQMIAWRDFMHDAYQEMSQAMSIFSIINDHSVKNGQVMNMQKIAAITTMLNNLCTQINRDRNKYETFLVDLVQTNFKGFKLA